MLLKLGHAQEMFQQRIEEEVGRLGRREEPGGAQPAGGALPNAAQQRALIEVDQAVLHLLDLAQGAEREASSASPRSVREGLALLQIRVRNLQRSFGLEPVPALGRPFDDRLHEAHGLCSRADLADGEIAEEILPGYRLRDRVVRPALVIVNRILGRS
jgi:molecular chaperone GrpE (heat shock protein)